MSVETLERQLSLPESKKAPQYHVVYFRAAGNVRRCSINLLQEVFGFNLFEAKAKVYKAARNKRGTSIILTTSFELAEEWAERANYSRDRHARHNPEMSSVSFMPVEA